jgi:hypothetical protein
MAALLMLLLQQRPVQILTMAQATLLQRIRATLHLKRRAAYLSLLVLVEAAALAAMPG